MCQLNKSVSTMTGFALFKALLFIGIIAFFAAVYSLQWNKYFDEKAVYDKDESGFCAAKNNMVFLKTHKTASTTLVMILHGYARRHRLIEAKPLARSPLKKFHRCSIYPLKSGYEYNIMALHTVFNYEEMKDLMPNDTVFLTILRDPVAQFESQYGYFSMEKVYGMNLTAFADLNTSLPEWSRVKNLRKVDKQTCAGRNPNAYDLGIDPELFEDEEAILEKVRELDKQFDLVMITELYDQSMILMKDRLCWEVLSDVTGVNIFVRTAKQKVSLSSEHMVKLREKNRADQMIYDHFYKKFLRQIDAFGKEKMEEEVEKLRALIKEMDEVCLEYKNVDHKRKEKGQAFVRAYFKTGAENHTVCSGINDKGMPKSLKDDFLAEPIECPD